MRLPRNEKLVVRSQSLRKEGTKEERHLWYDYLRTYPVHFYRQKVIKSFIVDFYCPKEKLVIELDGAQHYDEEGLEYDKARTLVLRKLGITVMRFSNRDIKRNFVGVCKAIDNFIKR